jgi:hypothetical protein
MLNNFQLPDIFWKSKKLRDLFWGGFSIGVNTDDPNKTIWIWLSKN